MSRKLTVDDIDLNKTNGGITILNKNIVMYKNHAMVLCKCSCGHEKTMMLYRVLKTTETLRCKKCVNQNNPEKYLHFKQKQIGDLGNIFYNNIRKAAKNRNLEFTVSKEFLWNLFLEQEGKCKLSGLDLNLKYNLIKGSIDYKVVTASLDRIDSSKGYVEDNVQWVHKTINILKSTLTNDEFIFFCKKVAKKYDNFEPSITDENIKMVMRVQRLTDDGISPNNSDTSAQHPLNMDEDIV